MIDNKTISDAEVMARFERCEAGENGFHHSDHVRVAFAYLKRYPVLSAIEKFCNGLKRFAAAHGKPDLYHETISWAYLLLIQERLASRPELREWDQFAAANPDLLRWKDGVMGQYYRPATLQSPLAKRVFVLPDRLAKSD